MSARRTRSTLDIPLGGGDDDAPPQDDRFHHDNVVFEEDEDVNVDIETNNLGAEDFSSAVHVNRRAANLSFREQLASSWFFSDVVPEDYTELVNRIRLPSDLRQTTRVIWDGLGKAGQKVFGLINPAQPVLVYAVADLTALGHAVEDIPRLTMQQYLDVTPLVKCTSKTWSPWSVSKVIGGDTKSITACQRGRPSLHRSDIFLLVAFDPDAVGGKEWHEIGEDGDRLQHFLDLADAELAQPVLVYAVADFVALGYAIEDIPGLTMQQYLEITPLVKCTNKLGVSQNCVQNVIGGNVHSISACQKGHPVLLRSDIFLLVAFDQYAVGGKEWDDIEEEDSRLKHFLDLAKYKQTRGAACYLCSFGTSNVLAVCPSIDALYQIIPRSQHDIVTTDDLTSAGDGGIHRCRTGPGDEDFAYTIHPLLGDHNAFAAKQQQIIRGATARVTALNATVMTYSRSQQGRKSTSLYQVIVTDEARRIIDKCETWGAARKTYGQSHYGLGRAIKAPDLQTAFNNTTDVNNSIRVKNNVGEYFEYYAADRFREIPFDDLLIDPRYTDKTKYKDDAYLRGTPKIIITTNTPGKRPLAGAASNREAGRYAGTACSTVSKALNSEEQLRNIPFSFRDANENDTMGPTALGKQRLPFGKDGKPMERS